jgi:hypothetical protein
MREIRLFGSEGGVALTLPSLPLTKVPIFWSEAALCRFISCYYVWACEVYQS